jgi:hypothetical protein
MAIDLNTWVPKLILEVLADRGGQTITAEDWNALWNKNTTQGDDTANALYAVLTQLRDTVWHATEGASRSQILPSPQRITLPLQSLLSCCGLVHC